VAVEGDQEEVLLQGHRGVPVAGVLPTHLAVRAQRAKVTMAATGPAKVLYF
jgi:hypothetical protein